MKQGARLYAFFDGIDVTSNCKQIRIPTGKTLQDLTDQYDNDGKIPAAANTVYYNLVADGVLRVDENYEVLGVFTVPANRFKVGTREFKLTDSSTNADSSTTTVARDTLQAVGISQIKSATVLNTKPFSISFDAVNVRSIPGRLTSSLTSDAAASVRRTGTVSPFTDAPRRPDPLSQSFYIDDASYPDGVFVTSIDSFFKTKSEDDDLGVSVEIREMENGLPTKKVIGGERARVLSSAITTSATAASATTFTFDSPIYLLPGNEYCFAVKPDGNADDFELWVAEIGQVDVTNTDTSIRIDRNNALIVVYFLQRLVNITIQ